MDATADLSDVTFDGNRGWETGGGIDNYLGAMSVTFGRFYWNSARFGGGVRNSNGGISVTDSYFYANSAEAGGGFSTAESGASATLTRTAFEWNTATWGGGVDSYAGTLVVDGGSFYGNYAASVGGGLFDNQSNTSVANSTFWSNSGCVPMA